jgi:hypothetical protein
VSDHDALVAGLRKWAHGNDPHRKAAVELLIADGYWLSQEDFCQAAVAVPTDGAGTAWIAWDRAGAFGKQAGASSSQKALLALAVSIGGDRYRLSRMDDRQAELIVRALATASGMEKMLHA